MATTVDTLLVRIEADMADLRKDLDRIGAQTEKTANKMQDSFAKVGRALSALGGAAALGGLVKGFIATGSQVENLGVRFNTLFGSVEEGSKAFQVMAAYASQVPFSLEDIQRGAAPLATVGKDAEQLGQLMKLTGNIAAASGMSFDEASQNVQRALTAGINSADMFRERGVSAMAGFQAGTTYSIQETVQKLNDAFGAGGKYDGITDNLAKTTTGALSMLGDSWFSFQRTVAESGLNDAFIQLVNAVKALADEIRPLAVVIGKGLGFAFSMLAGAVRAATRYLDGIYTAFTLLIGLYMAQKVSKLAYQFGLLAKVALINRNVFKSLNAIIRRNPLILLAIGAAATVEALGGINAVLEGLETQFPRVFGGLTDSAESFFAGAGEGMAELEGLLREPLRIELGTGTEGAKAAKKQMTELKSIISANTPPVNELQEQYNLLSANLDKFSGEAAEKAKDALITLGEKLAETEPMYASFKSGVQAMAASVSNAFADMLANGKLNMNSLKDIFRSFVKTMIAKAIELFVINRILSMIFPGAYTTTSAGAFIPRASGGAMSARQPYLVGERGPELIVPNSASTVMNSNNTRSALGGGGDTTIVQNINISTGVQQTVRSEIRSLMPEIANTAKAAVADTKRRGGSYGRAFA